MTSSITRRAVNAPDAPQTAARRYAQAVEISGASRTLYISGQIPVGADGHMPEDFESQARLAWANVEAQLRAAGMSLDNLVKLTVFLAGYEHRDINAKVRWEVMGDRTIALSTIITGAYDPAWLIEIEGIAVA
ncbi:RidA family protein [Aquamicrobium sp. LC103]|uniref:RidA family protein n=1 Tax=Aquamicrobium sp. LC103 TaxID=1120658 RepID=UPI001FF024F7|nr:RidA family protein [Aquamicrobium sp. LC103]